MKSETGKAVEDSEVKENKEQKQAEVNIGASADDSSKESAKPSSPRNTNSTHSRQPFTQLSQIESDMALARTLQEQERAYMLLRMGLESEMESSGSGSYEYNYNGEDESEDDDDEEPVEGDGELALENSTENIDGSQFENDEAFARALQEAEDRENASRMMALAGIHDFEEEENEDDGDGDVDGDGAGDGDGDGDGEGDGDGDGYGYGDDDDEEEEDVEDMWQDVDPDNMSYEELIALGEIVGVESRGLTASTIAELPVSTFKGGECCGSSSDCEQCVICRHDYEEEDSLLTLPCKHSYHSECVQQWLLINKVCPVCSAEVGGGTSSS